MSAGYLYRGVCRPSFDAATAAYWSDSPSSLAAGSTSYLTNVVWSGSTWVVNQYTVSGGSASLVASVPAPVLSFSPCDTSDSFMDGLSLGWGVVLAMAFAWAIRTQRVGL